MSLRELYGGITEVRKAALHRLEDARASYAAKRWRAAMYLAGYSVECQLKVGVMSRYKCFNLKELAALLIEKRVIGDAGEIYTHSLEKLLTLTGRGDDLRAHTGTLRDFSVVNRWVPAWRYSPDLSRPDDAEEFLQAAASVRHWVEVNV